MDGLVNLLELAGEIGGGGGDGGDSEGGAVPDDAVVELGYGEVEAVAELVFHGAKDLAAVFEGLSVVDLQFDGEFGDGHLLESYPLSHPAVFLRGNYSLSMVCPQGVDCKILKIEGLLLKCLLSGS